MKRTSWLTKIAAVGLVGVLSVYAACNVTDTVKCKALGSACTNNSPNCPEEPLTDYAGTVTASGSRYVLTGVDWNDPSAWGYDDLAQGEDRTCWTTCAITSDCLELSPEVDEGVVIHDVWTAGELCGPIFD